MINMLILIDSVLFYKCESTPINSHFCPLLRGGSHVRFVSGAPFLFEGQSLQLLLCRYPIFFLINTKLVPQRALANPQ